jgi:hypothetical protein
MQVKFSVRNVEKIQNYLKRVPRGALRTALLAATEYILGNKQHGLRHYSPYKYATRKSAYGFSFFSDKQRRYVMAKIRSGEIDPGVPHRTGETQRGWEFSAIGEGYKINIINATTSSYYTMDDYGQARQPAKVGWRKVSAVVASNLKGALRAATAAVNRYLNARK